MNNLERYNKVFQDVFNLKDIEFSHSFNNNPVVTWDSITQLTLVNSMEEEFDIMLDSDDILEFKSYEVGKRILEKYNVNI